MALGTFEIEHNTRFAHDYIAAISNDGFECEIFTVSAREYFIYIYNSFFAFYHSDIWELYKLINNWDRSILILVS